MSKATHRFVLNGRETAVEAAHDRPLLAVLRDDLGLRCARFGCGAEQCGACMVLVDGRPAFSCARDIATLAGREITTVEGLATDPVFSALHDAFIELQAAQCGYCIAGILISARALLAGDPAPDRASVVAALEPHLCRCGAHNRILAAVERAAANLAGAPA